MSKGTIKFYSSEKGYGFIYIKHSREDMYFHINDWKNQTPPVINDDVEFETTISKGKFKAINIRVIKSSTEKKEENFAKNDDRVICPGCRKKTDTKTSQLKILEKLLEESTSPTNLEELEDINGFGPVKVQEYGAAILEILKK